MSQLKRYDISFKEINGINGLDYHEKSNGFWVKFEDVQHLKSEIASLLQGYEQLERLDEWIEAEYLGTVLARLRQLSSP